MFESFFIAGFEGSTGYDRNGRWFDHVAATGHDRTVVQDYRNLADLGLRAARESIRWPLVDTGRGGRLDFASVEPFAVAAQHHRVEVIWDLFHYGFPVGLDLLSRDFTSRFADYCHAAARLIARRTDGTCWFTPVNEPSFMAYAAGDKGLFAPWLTGRGWEVKVALARAAIAGIDAIRAACPSARFVNVDPLCRVVAPAARPDLEAEAQRFNDELVFQAWDMLAGRLLPELGGSPAHLDVVGINYYWTNQWEIGGEPRADGVNPPLADDDPRRMPLADLVRSVWRRYGHHMLISETSHVGERRAPWIREVAGDCASLLREGVPVGGVCLYPILGMPEWHDPDVWTPMGLWDPVCQHEPHSGRIVCAPMLEALRAERRIEELHARRRSGGQARRSAAAGGRGR